MPLTVSFLRDESFVEFYEVLLQLVFISVKWGMLDCLKIVL